MRNQWKVSCSEIVNFHMKVPKLLEVTDLVHFDDTLHIHNAASSVTSGTYYGKTSVLIPSGHHARGWHGGAEG